MGLSRELSISLAFFTVAWTNALAAQVRLHGGEYITYGLRKVANPRQTVIKLRFRTIHPNGLLMYSNGPNDFLQLDVYHGQVR